MNDPQILTSITIGESLFILRRRGGLTLGDLSEKSGLTDRKITFIEKDNYKHYRVSDMVKAFDAFGIELEVTIRDENEVDEDVE